MSDYLWNVWLTLGLMTAFVFVGDVIHSYTNDYQEAKARGENPETIDAPDLFVIVIGAFFVTLAWPACWWVMVKSKFNK